MTHDDNGRPELLVAGGAKTALKELAGGANVNIFLSLTDQDDYSAAVVVIEK